MSLFESVTGKALPLVFVVLAFSPLGSSGAEIIDYAGDGTDLQQILDTAPEQAVIACDPSQTLTFHAPLQIRKALTLCGLHARLPEKLGRTALIEVKAEGVTLLDLELHGNYDSVSQDERSTMISIARGNFRVERCAFFDSSKDGVMITPAPGQGDLIGGVVRDIEAHRMGRDAVSISGGNHGAKVKNVTVENVNLKTGYLRGAVEVSDGTENISVRNVHAEQCVYAVDIQDHRGDSAANVNVTFDGIEAIDCTHIVRTANSPRGHANLVLHDLVGIRCKRPLVISHTQNVVLENVRIEQLADDAAAPVHIRNCHGVSIKGLSVAGKQQIADDLQLEKCSGVTIVTPPHHN